ncbi:MAG: LLM class flavin-dependent oxidoreductase [Acidimicrobiales bacterium]|nr:LLM class flavin-dependent oxidoreductase [Acidimicrobiales bacterium]
MRVGVSLSSSVNTPDPAQAAKWMIERTRVADRVALDSLSVGDHHAMAWPYYQNTPILGRLLAEWGPRPVGCLFLVPLWHPVLIAEHVGTLASLVDGADTPFIVQTGIGSGAGQFAAMGAELGSRGTELERRLAIAQALVAGEAVSSDDVHPGAAAGSASHTVQLGLVPARPVEWWIGAGVPRALERAARMGTAWYGGPNLDAESGAAAIAHYRAACAELGKAPRSIVRKDAIVLADPGAAVARRDEILAQGYRGMTAGQVVAGTPAEVADQLAPFAELGFDDVIVRCMSVTQPEALETIELLAEVRSLLR